MTAPATPPDWDALARYLSGESSAEEAAVVRGWLDAHPADRVLVDRLQESALELPPADVDVEAALTRVHERMHAPQLTVHRGGAGAERRGGYKLLVGVAGGLAAAAVAFVVARRFRTEPVHDTTVASAQTYSTGVGQRDSVLLADGSRIVLGPQTRLTVLAGYGAPARTVELTGDAYFDVKHDAAKPFSIRTGKAIIEDIGTTFSVESDAVNATTVSVVTGRVRLRAESTQGVELGAGDRGTIDATGQTTVEQKAVNDDDTAWISGRLAFRDAPLSRVAAELQRWYRVKLVVPDSMAARHVTTSFEGNSVDQVLNILGLTLGAKIERQGDSAAVFTHTR